MQGSQARGQLLYRAEVKGKGRADVDPRKRRDKGGKEKGEQKEIGGERQCRSCARWPTVGHSWTEGVCVCVWLENPREWLLLHEQEKLTRKRTEW